jgi:hypothetical protein
MNHPLKTKWEVCNVLFSQTLLQELFFILKAKLSKTSKFGPGDLPVIRSARYIECQQKIQF